VVVGGLVHVCAARTSVLEVLPQDYVGCCRFTVQPASCAAVRWKGMRSSRMSPPSGGQHMREERTAFCQLPFTCTGRLTGQRPLDKACYVPVMILHQWYIAVLSHAPKIAALTRHVAGAALPRLAAGASASPPSTRATPTARCPRLMLPRTS
jgi:hypothetical protein